MVANEKQAQANSDKPASSEVFRAQTEIIKRCPTVHQLDYVRECIVRTVDGGFDAKLAEQLYQIIDARKAELEAASPEPVKK